MVAAAVVGVVVLLNAPYVTRSMAAAQVWVDRKLLGPSRPQPCGPRWGTGAQPLPGWSTPRTPTGVASNATCTTARRPAWSPLPWSSGRAKAHFDDDPERAKALVTQAHEDAKTALVELRSLVRGVHPPVLSDRGLDAALSGLAAICPVPVTVQVEVTKRPSATVEAVAYFVVAESLTNVAKHSGAVAATVTVRSKATCSTCCARQRRGGALPTGAGLAGLADRVQAVDGHLSILSPVGGPTVIEVEIPCVS